VPRNFQAEFIIIGSGPGGATVGRELAARGRDVLILEKGNFSGRSVLHRNRTHLAKKGMKFIRKSLGIQPLSREISIRTWIGVGGTSTVASANAVRGWEKELHMQGIDIGREFSDLEKSLSISPFPGHLMGPGANMIREASDFLGIPMELMPKIIDFERCESCGQCNRRCPTNAKWTAERFIEEALDFGARLMQDVTAVQVQGANGKATGVKAVDSSGADITIHADRIILAAGALGTPVILQNSGLDTPGSRLFCHPFWVVSGPVSGRTLKQEPRSIFSRHFLDKGGFLLANDIVDGHLAILIKVKDREDGRVFPDGIIRKEYSATVLRKAHEAMTIAEEILVKAGADHRKIRRQNHAALHPGGTAAIGHVVDANMETELKNCFVADASVLPASAGIPPLLTILALSKRLGKNIH
jgi:choline dehydrogenase-like flavoprotein